MTAQTRDCTQRHFVGHLLPAQGLGVPCAAGINDRRVTHKVCWVNVPAASRRPRRAGTSTVAAGVPPCQPRERSRFNNCAGSVTASRPPGTVAIARCQDFRLPSGIAKRNAVRVLGTGKPEDGRPWSSSDGLPDQLQRGDKSGQFWEWSALKRSLRSGRLAKRPKAGRSWRQARPAPTWPICEALQCFPWDCRRSERDQRERRTCEPFTPREERSDEAFRTGT